MNRRSAKLWTGIMVSAAVCLVGCGPAGSLFPLFQNGDKEFDERLLGEWRMQDGTSFKHGEDSGRIEFRKSADGTEYEVTLYDFDAQGVDMATTAHLVRLGSYLFIDFGAQHMDKRKISKIPFPTVQSHLLGRIHLGKDSVRIDLLRDDWLTEQKKAGTLAIASVETADGLVISATTEELRKFALEHAEDATAFSDTYSFSRTQ